MVKSPNYQKEMYRGTIKQIMKVRGLRTISLHNFNKWKNKNVDFSNDIHSLKLNLQDGYINMYPYAITSKKGITFGCAIEDATTEQYKNAFEQVMEIINNEKTIPSKVKRNILVGISR